MYKPQPINTNDVKLPIELELLAEEIAKNGMRSIAQSRVNGG